MNSVKCLNPWDIQSKHVFDVSGISETLYSGECRWGGGEHYVCYAIEDGTINKATDNVIVFVPYGSRLGFHEEGIAATMARMDYKFPQCVCYEKEHG